MKKAHLKNTVIAILLLTNFFLAVSLVTHVIRENAARRRTYEELEQLFASNEIQLSVQRMPDDEQTPAPVEPQRSLGEEMSFALDLLGPCSVEEVGGGIYRHTNASGQCMIRAGGAVEASMQRAVSSPDAFANDLFSRYGYRRVSDEFADGRKTICGIRELSDMTVFNATLALTFSQDRLTAVDGFFIPKVETAPHSESMDAVTALVRFLDYSNANGEVCTSVEDVTCGYLLHNTAFASQRLLPAWRITTDVSRYYVNAVDGEVTRDS